MYTETTHDICITVVPHFIHETSRHEENLYMWAYQVSIKNNSTHRVNLRRRYWCIIDAHGNRQEVRGTGVVGEQPILSPGDTYEYTSGTALRTPSGIIQGSYEMEKSDGAWLTVQIPAFSLDSPFQVVSIQ